MPRVKRGFKARRRRNRVLKHAKGYYGARRKTYRVAKQAVIKAGQYSYRDRRQRKRQFRSLWIVRINAAARLHDTSYSKLMHGLKVAGVQLDIGKSRDELVAILGETVARNEMETDVHVRLMVTRGTKKTPSQDPRLVTGAPNIVVIAEHKIADPSVVDHGIRLATSQVRRPPPETIDQRWNCHSKIHEVVALLQALEAGGDEALMLDVAGNVATCNATNFFIVAGGRVWTSTGEHCLNGITRISDRAFD